MDIWSTCVFPQSQSCLRNPPPPCCCCCFCCCWWWCAALAVIVPVSPLFFFFFFTRIRSIIFFGLVLLFLLACNEFRRRVQPGVSHDGSSCSRGIYACSGMQPSFPFFLVFCTLPVCFIVFWKDEWRERSDGDVIRSVVAFWNRMQEDMNRFYKPPGWRRDCCHLTLIKMERCSTASLFLFSLFLCLSFLLPPPPADSVAFHTLSPFYVLPLSALSFPSVSLVTLFFWLL